MAHATLSPSSAVRWMACPGSVALTAGMPDQGSDHAAEGTVAHEVAQRCLQGSVDAASMIGWDITVDGRTWTVDADMAQHVQAYVDRVRAIVQATQGELLVEQRLPIGQITGEDGAHGTADAVILAGDEIIVIDLKFGRGVQVDAEDNPQLQIYALAALDEFGLAGDFSRVRMIIDQPRLGAVSEWAQTADQLREFGDRVTAAAYASRQPDAPLNPTAKGCRWCKAKATCPALSAHVEATVGADFEALEVTETRTKLYREDAQFMPRLVAAHLAAVDLIEDWCKAVRAEAERRLLAGEPVPGFKLVQGRRGHRAWTDAAQVEALFKDVFRLRVDEMYDLSLISPTSAEKLAPKFGKDGKPLPPKAGAPKPVFGPLQWKKVTALIYQPEGKPSVAPESDKRPALVLQASADEFSTVTPEPACDLA